MTTDEGTGKTCTHCGCDHLDEGFIEDDGDNSRGFARWVAGPLQRGLLGGAKLMGRRRRGIAAFRCPRCGHLELFAGEEI